MIPFHFVLSDGATLVADGEIGGASLGYASTGKTFNIEIIVRSLAPEPYYCCANDVQILAQFNPGF